jgi:hypothetical protein
LVGFFITFYKHLLRIRIYRFFFFFFLRITGFNEVWHIITPSSFFMRHSNIDRRENLQLGCGFGWIPVMGLAGSAKEPEVV